jgi:hypothetical protein
MVCVAVSSRGTKSLVRGARWGCRQRGLRLVVEGVFEGGALGGGADFAVDVGVGVQVRVAEDA